MTVGSSLVQSLHLSTIADGIPPGISKDYGSSLAEAAAVCLESQNHSSGVWLIVDGTYSQTFSLFWDHDVQAARASWADMPFTTEQGAYCIAALLIRALTNYTLIERSYKGTGFDYWLGSIGAEVLLFQKTARLEVSGILQGDEAAISTRAKQKISQASRSQKTGLPAFIVIVEFKSPRSRIVKKT